MFIESEARDEQNRFENLYHHSTDLNRLRSFLLSAMSSTLVLSKDSCVTNSGGFLLHQEYLVDFGIDNLGKIFGSLDS